MAQLVMEIQEMSGPGLKTEVSRTFGKMANYPKEAKGGPARAAVPRGTRIPRPRLGIRTGNCPYIEELA